MEVAFQGELEGQESAEKTGSVPYTAFENYLLRPGTQLYDWFTKIINAKGRRAFLQFAIQQSEFATENMAGQTV